MYAKFFVALLSVAAVTAAPPKRDCKWFFFSFCIDVCWAGWLTLSGFRLVQRTSKRHAPGIGDDGSVVGLDTI